MPETLGQTFTKKAGPLPIWAWAGLGTAGLAGFMYYRNKKKAAAAAAAQQQQGLGDSSNLGTVPISDLTTAASPMPIQMGDTFVNVDTGDNDTPPSPKPAPCPQGLKRLANGKCPPIGHQPPPHGKKPPPTKPPPPPQSKPGNNQTVTVCPYPQWCGSLWGIANHLWGNGNLWPAIYKANQGAIGSNPNLIHPGLVLNIPAQP